MSDASKPSTYRPIPESADSASEVREPALATPDGNYSLPGPYQLHGLADVLTPDLRVPSVAALAQARRGALARVELAQEFGLLSSAEVAELAGSKAKNRAALANRWKQEGRIFSVAHRGQQLWPAFQFDAEGQPLAAVAEILSILGETSGSPWALALWLTSHSGWLDGRRPVDLLESDPAAVIEATRRESEPIFV